MIWGVYLQRSNRAISLLVARRVYYWNQSIGSVFTSIASGHLAHSDTTLKRDRELKAPVYAQSGIQDYWILDVNQRQLYVFRSPTPTGYANEVVLSEADVISPLAFAECQIAIREMLRPQQCE